MNTYFLKLVNEVENDKKRNKKYNQKTRSLMTIVRYEFSQPLNSYTRFEFKYGEIKIYVYPKSKTLDMIDSHHYDCYFYIEDFILHILSLPPLKGKNSLLRLNVFDLDRFVD
jgi:hypothetical protein